MQWMSSENIDQIAVQYRALGPLVGFLISYAEAFLPFLPLVAFIAVNVTAYGLFWGFLLSWMGTLFGSYCVFLLVRKFGNHRYVQRFTSGEKTRRLIRSVNLAGITPLLLLLCFPFTPGILVNIGAGLSNIKRIYYFWTLVVSKFVMVFMLTFIFQDVRSLVKSPYKLIVVFIILILLWGGGKLFEKHMNKRVVRDLKEIRDSGAQK